MNTGIDFTNENFIKMKLKESTIYLRFLNLIREISGYQHLYNLRKDYISCNLNQDFKIQIYIYRS